MSAENKYMYNTVVNFCVSTFSGKFVPFKTPLDEKYDSMVPEANRFNIPMLIASMKTYKV